MQFWNGYGKMSSKMQPFWTECEELGWMKGPLMGRQEQACISYFKNKSL